ncbi:MAG: SGNH/GDSL hydrolase family protein [Ruminococcus sp.]|nr:SGNH/GDSL hydrolase family protein [Ruminococcus sp.]
MYRKTAIADLGDINYLGAAFKKAEEEKKLSIVYLGGSITQGCNASTQEKRYVDLSAGWWKRRFPDLELTCFNAGIGATTSQFGAARVEDHVLSHEPDVVFVEFSVNDSDNMMFFETYESLIRRLLKNGGVRAVVIINNLFYDTGMNAQNIHNAVGRQYGLPIVSVRDNVYPRIMLGEIDPKVYTDDMLHPTDIGHKNVAELICELLDEEYEIYKKSELTGKPDLAPKLTKCRYEDAAVINNLNSSPELDGFTPDTHVAEQFCDPFKNGWTASAKGSSISFEVRGSIIMIQWRRSVKQPAPVAYAVIDGKEQERVKLDANFDETWGDLCCLTMLTDKAEKGVSHRLTVTLEEEGTASDFMLISVITADR